MRLSVLDFSYHDKDAFDSNDFKYKALITNFCTNYQALQELLLQYTEPKCPVFPESSDINSILKKFQYEGWLDNVVEHFYIQPFFDFFLLLKADFCKHYSMGFEFWRVPLCKNEQILLGMIAMINKECQVETILGNRLKREQLYFTFQSLNSIFKGKYRQNSLTIQKKSISPQSLSLSH